MNNRDVEVTLNLILAKLGVLEKTLGTIESQLIAPKAETAVLREKLSKLTIKRHAVFTATLSGVSYQEIAKHMQCDLTTVKLHLKAVLAALDIRDRSVLLATHKSMLDSISEAEYESLFGISKRWWMELRPDLMAVLTTKKNSANQYSKASVDE